MCDNHTLVDDNSWLRRKIMNLYSRLIDDTLGFYLFLGRGCTWPFIGPVIRYFAIQYGKHFHGGRAATVEECFEIIDKANTITVVDCACRKRTQGCDAPLNACLMVNTGAEVFSETKGSGYITEQEAKDIINTSFEAGLIRNIHHCFSPNIYSICNCCTCCCIPYKLRKDYGISTSVVNGLKRAELNGDKCKKCLRCEQICPQGAIDVNNGIVHADQCLGCGLCIPACREQALIMIPRGKHQSNHPKGKIQKFIMYFTFLGAILPLAAAYKSMHRK